MEKNLLSDTDYTKGWDNRYGVTAVIGKVSKIECTEKGANARIIMPDRIDHDSNPLISKPVPVLQLASKGKKSFAMPRQNDNVLMVKLPNGTSNYAIIGSFYTSKDPPPVTDPKVDYCEWEGGHIEKHDANDDAEVFLEQDFKGGVKTTVKKDIEIKTTDGGKMSMTSDGDMLVKSATGNINVESPSGTVNIKQQDIHLTGRVTIDGDIIHTGNMTTSGHHTDANGLHTGGLERDARIEELLSRVDVLERKLSIMLDARHESRISALEGKA
jgi:phage baseplate assembly protein gpV